MEKALNAISENEIGGTITSPAGSSKAPDKRRGESFSDHSKKIPQVFRNELGVKSPGLDLICSWDASSSLSSATVLSTWVRFVPRRYLSDS
jgi:hypothetical protein